MSSELSRTLQLELRNLNRDIEALEYQLEEKRKALDLLTNVYEQIKATQAAMPRRRTKQPISKMIVKVLTGRKKGVKPKVIQESLARAGYVGSPAVMYATLGRLVKAGKLKREKNGYYALV